MITSVISKLGQRAVYVHLMFVSPPPGWWEVFTVMQFLIEEWRMCYNVTVLPFGMFIYCFNEDFICINTRLSRYFPDMSLLIVFNLCEQIIQHLKVSLSHFCHRCVLAPAVLTDNFVYFTGRIQVQIFQHHIWDVCYHKTLYKPAKKYIQKYFY